MARLMTTRQVGATLQTTAFSRAQLLVARFITGIGTGIETTTVPVYQSELCEAKKRGKYVCSEPLFVGVGIVIAYWFDYGMSYVPGAINWRLPIACQMIFAIMVILLVFGWVFFLLVKSPAIVLTRSHIAFPKVLAGYIDTIDLMRHCKCFAMSTTWDPTIPRLSPNRKVSWRLLNLRLSMGNTNGPRFSSAMRSRLVDVFYWPTACSS